jgi:hypothetical protein
LVDIVLTGGGMPPDIQYYLDGSIECMDITPDVWFWAKYFCPNITNIIDSFDNDPHEIGNDDNTSYLTSWGNKLESIYLNWQKQTDTNNVALCLAYGLHYSRNKEIFLQEICNTLVDDENSPLRGIKFYDNIIRYTKNNMVYYDGVKLFEHKRHFFDSLVRIKNQWDNLSNKPDFTNINIKYSDETLEALQYKRSIVQYELPKQKKKALRKSSDLLDTITGEKTTQLYLSGNEISVTGQKYRFALQKAPYSTLSTSHGSVTTKVYDKATNEFICGLCVYSANVTVFDHIASIVLHCKAGMEDQIIMDANVTEKGNIELLPEDKLKAFLKSSLNELTDQLFSDKDLETITGIKKIKSREKIIEKENKKAQTKLFKTLKKKYGNLLLNHPYKFDNVPLIARQ